MATSATFDFGGLDEGVVKLTSGEAKYSFLSDGSIKLGDSVLSDAEGLKKAAKEFTSAAKAASANEIAEANHALALREIYKKLSPTQAESLRGISSLFEAAEKFEEAVGRLPKDAAAEAAHVSELRKIMVAHPEVMNIVDANTSNVVKGVNTFEKLVDGVKKQVPVVDFAKLDGEVKGLRSAIDKLVKAHGDSGYTEASVKKILSEAPAGIHEVLPQEVVDKFLAGAEATRGKAAVASMDLNHIATLLNGEINAAQAEAVRLSQNINALKAEAERSFFKSGFERKIEAEGEKLAKLVKDNPDIKHHIDDAMKKALSTEERTVVASVKSASSAMSSLGSASGSDKPGFFKRLFTWTEENVAEKKKGLSGDALKKFEEKVKVGNMRTSRVIVGIAGVGAAVYAATAMLGGRDKDKPSFTEREEARRAQGQAQGNAVGA